MREKENLVSVGLPVYNGEKYIKKRLDNILNQTYHNIELIISDNDSNDETSDICKKYESEDSRIRYFFQKNQIPITENFGFVLEKAKGKYFLWASADDLLESTFIEKNLEILETKKNIVCSSGQVQSFGERTQFLKEKETDSKFTKWKKKIGRNFSELRNIPTNGSYEENVRLYLKLRGHEQVFYGLFRTEQLRKMMVYNLKQTFDWAVILNGLKYGNYFVVEDTHMFRYDGGISSRGIFNMKKRLDLGLFDTIFMNGRFIFWCWKNLGKKLFLKNLDCFIQTIFDGFRYVAVDIIRSILKKIIRN